MGVKCLVAADSFKTQDYHKLLVEIVPELQTSVPGDLNSEAVPSLKSVVMMSDKEHSGAFRWEIVCPRVLKHSEYKSDSLTS